jgi:hypothetical protein
LSTTLSKIWLSVGPFFRSFDHNSLVSRPFLARKVSNRRSHYVLQNGPGVVSLIQLSVWSTVRSNLGQTWSTLVKLGRIWSKPSKIGSKKDTHARIEEVPTAVLGGVHARRATITRRAPSWRAPRARPL